MLPIRGTGSKDCLIMHLVLPNAQLGMNNIFDRRYMEHLSYQRDRFRSGARIYEPGWSILVNLSYRH
jgi:outer membrane receptor protein involved in Fe transport